MSATPVEVIDLSSDEEDAQSSASEDVKPRKKLVRKSKAKAVESSSEEDEKDFMDVDSTDDEEEDTKKVKQLAKKLTNSSASKGKGRAVDVKALAKAASRSLKGKGKAVDTKPKIKKTTKDVGLSGFYAGSSDDDGSDFAPPDSDVSMSEKSSFDSDVDTKDLDDDLTLDELDSSDEDSSEPEVEEMPKKNGRKGADGKPKPKTRKGHLFSKKEKKEHSKMTRVSCAVSRTRYPANLSSPSTVPKDRGLPPGQPPRARRRLGRPRCHPSHHGRARHPARRHHPKAPPLPA